MKLKKKILSGVVLVLRSLETGRFLVVRELQSKKGIKREGQLSFPSETVFLGEDKESALKRTFIEEVGILPNDNLEYMGELTWIDREDVRADVSIYLSWIEEEFISRPKDATDVAFHGWMSLDEILSHDIRLGMPETVFYLKKKITE